MKNLVQCCLLVVMICSVFLSDQVHSYPSVDETKRDELTQNNADSSDPFREQIEEMEKRQHMQWPNICKQVYRCRYDKKQRKCVC